MTPTKLQTAMALYSLFRSCCGVLFWHQMLPGCVIPELCWLSVQLCQVVTGYSACQKEMTLHSLLCSVQMSTSTTVLGPPMLHNIMLPWARAIMTGSPHIIPHLCVVMSQQCCLRCAHCLEDIREPFLPLPTNINKAENIKLS